MNRQPFTIRTDIKKPDLDDRSYAVLTLSNNLQVLLVSDPHTDKAGKIKHTFIPKNIKTHREPSAAAMDVHVGHLSDPDEAAGLAHFCEHLLFMGNEKYPSENEYSQFLAAHGGSSNAFTAADHTNYYFDVKADSLYGALDRFLQFFICPIFSPSCTEREMKAVDSEHKKNINSDAWRIYQLQKDHMNPEHPYRKFGTGNLVTLKEWPESKGVDIREVLLEFHAKYYSANIMKLVVLGKESLEELTDWVVDLASAIKNKDVPVPAFPGHPLTKPLLESELLVKPVKDLREVEIIFPLPYQIPHYRTNPASYLAHLIGHESNGSILALLKKRGWAQELSASASTGAVNFDFFKVAITLTKDGSDNWEQVVTIVFEYIRMLQNEAPQEWIFNECKTMASTSFRFLEKWSPSTFACRVAGRMQNYPVEDFLRGPYAMDIMDRNLIQGVLDCLKPENFYVTVVSPDFDSTGWKQADWYKTEHLCRPFSPTLKAALANLVPNPELHLPLKNEFIPTDFELRDKIADQPVRPSIIRETPFSRLWYKKDDTFLNPKSRSIFIFRSPSAYVTPTESVLTSLFIDILIDALNAFSYYASVAGLSFDMDTTTDGIKLSIYGYNHKAAVLLKRIVETMDHLVIDPERFKAIKETLLRSYKNWYMEQPYQHAMYFVTYLTQEVLWTPAEKLQALQAITLEDVKAFYPQLLHKFYVEGLVHGNVSSAEALELVNLIESILVPEPVPYHFRHRSVRTHVIPQGKRYIQLRNVVNPNEPNSAIEYNIQIGDAKDDPIRVLTLLFAQIAKEPCFNVLRTKEQLGYIVSGGVRKQTGVIGYRVIVQSEKSPWHLEERVTAFLESMKATLESMTDEEFKKNVDALAFSLLEKSKNLYEEASRHWGHVTSGYYDFDQNVRDAEAVKHVTRKELLGFYESFISPCSMTLRKLSVHMRSSKMHSHPQTHVAVAASPSAALGATPPADSTPVPAQTPVVEMTDQEHMAFYRAKGEIIVMADEVPALKMKLELGPSCYPVQPIAEYFAKGVSLVAGVDGSKL
ncbi:hypothetical protein HDV05_007475 [Chytridiales sp. JEL 0842]|nr:hypothetical protein HDV05_007475 [Chytridiales sp. JEL 0842]